MHREPLRLYVHTYIYYLCLYVHRQMCVHYICSYVALSTVYSKKQNKTNAHPRTSFSSHPAVLDVEKSVQGWLCPTRGNFLWMQEMEGERGLSVFSGHPLLLLNINNSFLCTKKLWHCTCSSDMSSGTPAWGIWFDLTLSQLPATCHLVTLKPASLRACLSWAVKLGIWGDDSRISD